MKKKNYTAPQAEWLEAVNAGCFLEESNTFGTNSLEDLQYEDLGDIWS